MKVTALIKTLSPLHITMPDAARVSLKPENGGLPIVWGDKNQKSVPLIRTQRQNVLNPEFTSQMQPEFTSQMQGGVDSVVAEDGVDEKVLDDPVPQGEEKQKKSHVVMRMPVIPANNLAGHMRRHAASLVLDALRVRGETVSLPVYSCLQSGAWTGSPDSADVTYEEYMRAKAHPYVGLFGGGPRMMRKGFATYAALPALSLIRDALRTPVTASEPMAQLSDAQMTQLAFFRRNDDIQDLANLTQMQDSLADFEQALTTYQAAVLEGKSAKDGEDKSRVSCYTFSAIEFVVPGVLFDAAFDLRDDLTPAQIGLFLLTVDRFAERDVLGGWSRNGFGRFAIERLEIDGESVFQNGRLDRIHFKVSEWIAAWEDAARNLTVDELNYLFRQGKPKKSTKDEKEKKAKKDRAATAVEKLQNYIDNLPGRRPTA